MFKPVCNARALAISLALAPRLRYRRRALSWPRTGTLTKHSAPRLSTAAPRVTMVRSPAGQASCRARILGGALSLVSTTSSLVNMGNVLSLGEFPSGSFSIAAWVRSSTPSTETQMIASKTDFTIQSGFAFGFNPDRWWRIRRIGRVLRHQRNSFRGHLDDAGQRRPMASGGGHVRAAAGCFADIRGLRAGRKHGRKSGLHEQQCKFPLGGVNINAQPVSYLTGLLDEVKVFDGVLSQAEVEALYSVEGIFHDGFD